MTGPPPVLEDEVVAAELDEDEALLLDAVLDDEELALDDATVLDEEVAEELEATDELALEVLPAPPAPPMPPSPPLPVLTDELEATLDDAETVVDPPVVADVLDATDELAPVMSPPAPTEVVAPSPPDPSEVDDPVVADAVALVSSDSSPCVAMMSRQPVSVMRTLTRSGYIRECFMGSLLWES